MCSGKHALHPCGKQWGEDSVVPCRFQIHRAFLLDELLQCLQLLVGGPYRLLTRFQLHQCVLQPVVGVQAFHKREKRARRFTKTVRGDDNLGRQDLLLQEYLYLATSASPLQLASQSACPKRAAQAARKTNMMRNGT